jgi:hypothetical protein
MPPRIMAQIGQAVPDRDGSAVDFRCIAKKVRCAGLPGMRPSFRNLSDMGVGFAGRGMRPMRFFALQPGSSSQT